ncbi:nucleotidyltransferase domain-containing protein [Geodermatophilus sabuli]|uniref:Nucleotidyltransferase domain-containing protein n=1 Tax=Geodermatophilus sabuli TaxID=1564158 RepID=A0A7K3W425_9ACTN|nr:nucleotidyltransferase domain-containing protein [Geodermatophilus sabuli]
MPEVPPEIAELAARLATVPGVVGVTLGGSRARGDHTADSDTDLGLYYRPPLDTGALGTLAREVSGPGATVTRPGEWGPWVDGGAWLRIGGRAVDWIYRDVDRVAAAGRDARAGRVAFHAQVGHPLGFLDAAYAGELALGVVLADPSGELAALRRQVADHPPALGAALVARLEEARFCVTIAGKGAARGDTAYVAGCLFRAVGLSAAALHGRAGRWLVTEKGAVAAAGRLPGAPPGFAGRAQAVLAALGTDAATLRGAVAAAGDLVAEVSSACAAGRDLSPGPRSPR